VLDVPPAAAREGLVGSGMPAWLVEQLDGAFAKIRGGELAATTDTVALLTGRPPRRVHDFLADHAQAFAAIKPPA
jgi:hypothetical protein